MLPFRFVSTSPIDFVGATKATLCSLGTAVRVFGSAVAILSAQAPPATAVTELTATPKPLRTLRLDNRANAMLRTGEPGLAHSLFC
jgi:hypothetical protein